MSSRSFAAFCAVGAGLEHAIHAGMRAGIHAMSQVTAGEAKRDGSEDETQRLCRAATCST